MSVNSSSKRWDCSLFSFFRLLSKYCSGKMKMKTGQGFNHFLYLCFVIPLKRRRENDEKKNEGSARGMLVARALAVLCTGAHLFFFWRLLNPSKMTGVGGRLAICRLLPLLFSVLAAPPNHDTPTVVPV